jgi:hypothetical protein
MKSIRGFATLLGTIVLLVLGLRMLNSGAIVRSKDSTRFNHDAATKAIIKTIKPFEDNLQDLGPKREES